MKPSSVGLIVVVCLSVVSTTCTTFPASATVRTVVVEPIWSHLEAPGTGAAFGNITDVVGGPNGTVWVLDKARSRIRAFDSQGNLSAPLLLASGTSAPTRMFDAGTRVGVLFSGASPIRFFDANLLPAGQITPSTSGTSSDYLMVNRAAVVGSGFAFQGVTYSVSSQLERAKALLILADANGHETSRLAEASTSWDSLSSGSGGNVLTVVTGVLFCGGSQLHVVRDPYRYEVENYDTSGSLLTTAELECVPREATAEERAFDEEGSVRIRAEVAAAFPSYEFPTLTRMPCVEAVWPRNDGSIWVSRRASPGQLLAAGHFAQVDVFNSSAQYIETLGFWSSAFIPGDMVVVLQNNLVLVRGVIGDAAEALGGEAFADSVRAGIPNQIGVVCCALAE